MIKIDKLVNLPPECYLSMREANDHQVQLQTARRLNISNWQAQSDQAFRSKRHTTTSSAVWKTLATHAWKKCAPNQKWRDRDTQRMPLSWTAVNQGISSSLPLCFWETMAQKPESTSGQEARWEITDWTIQQRIKAKEAHLSEFLFKKLTDYWDDI